MNDLFLLALLLMGARLKSQKSEETDKEPENVVPALEDTPRKEIDEEKETVQEDNYDLFPVTYLPDMYLVQEDVAAEDDKYAAGIIRKSVAKTTIEKNETSFDEAEQSIIRLFLTPGINKDTLLITLKDYCDHLHTLAKEGTLDKIFDESRKR